jgi:hypothetical protein
VKLILLTGALALLAGFAIAIELALLVLLTGAGLPALLALAGLVLAGLLAVLALILALILHLLICLAMLLIALLLIAVLFVRHGVLLRLEVPKNAVLALRKRERAAARSPILLV